VKAETINTGTAYMENLELGKVITPNGDIGYHFPIYDKNATF